MSGTQFGEESPATSQSDIEKLLESNVNETGFTPLKKSLKPDFSVYSALYDSGHMRIFTIRVGQDLVGFCVMIINPHHHYGGAMWATQDVMYVRPEHRGLTSIKFIRWIDDLLFADKVMVISRQVSVQKDYAAVLERMGYGEVETVFAKVRGESWD